MDLKKVKQILLLKYKSLSVIKKASLCAAVCGVLQKGLSLLTTPIFTRVLTSSEYGTVATYLTWFDMLSIIGTLCVYQGVFNNAMVKYERQRKKVVTSFIGLTYALTTGLLICYCSNISFWNKIMGLDTAYMLGMFVHITAYSPILIWLSRDNYEFNYKRLLSLTLARFILNPCLSLIFLLLIPNHSMARVGGIIAADLVMGGYLLLCGRATAGIAFDKEMWIYAVKFNLPLLPHLLSANILNSGDRVMIAYMVGKEAVGYYNIAYQIGMLPCLAVNALTVTFVPWLYRQLGNRAEDNIRQKINLMLYIIFPVLIVLDLFAPEVMYLLAPDEYREALGIIPTIVAGTYFIFLFTLFANVECYFEKTKYLSIASLSASMINVILNYIFIPMFSYRAAAYTTLVSYMLIAVLHYLFMIKTLKSNHLKPVLDQAFVLLFSTVIVAVTGIAVLSYRSTAGRYFLILILIIILFMKRDVIIKFFKEI